MCAALHKAALKKAFPFALSSGAVSTHLAPRTLVGNDR